jgi:hypothetical protein
MSKTVTKQEGRTETVEAETPPTALPALVEDEIPEPPKGAGESSRTGRKPPGSRMSTTPARTWTTQTAAFASG